jgi:hypothetical protein
VEPINPAIFGSRLMGFLLGANSIHENQSKRTSLVVSMATERDTAVSVSIIINISGLKLHVKNSGSPIMAIPISFAYTLLNNQATRVLCNLTIVYACTDSTENGKVFNSVIRNTLP